MQLQGREIRLLHSPFLAEMINRRLARWPNPWPRKEGMYSIPSYKCGNQQIYETCWNSLSLSNEPSHAWLSEGFIKFLCYKESLQLTDFICKDQFLSHSSLPASGSECNCHFDWMFLSLVNITKCNNCCHATPAPQKPLLLVDSPDYLYINYGDATLVSGICGA
jgi:hypothetical protein